MLDVDFVLVLVVAFFLVVCANWLAVVEERVEVVAVDDPAATVEAASAAFTAMRPPTPKNMPAARPPDTILCLTEVGRRVLSGALRGFMPQECAIKVCA